MICEGSSTSFLIYGFVIQMISNKTLLAKVLQAMREMFLHESSCNCNSYKFSYKFAYTLFFPFLRNQKQESSLQQVGGLVTRNISTFYLNRAAPYCGANLNQIHVQSKLLTSTRLQLFCFDAFRINFEKTNYVYFDCFFPLEHMFAYLDFYGSAFSH